MHSQIVCSSPDCDWLERLQCKSIAAVVKADCCHFFTSASHSLIKESGGNVFRLHLSLCLAVCHVVSAGFFFFVCRFCACSDSNDMQLWFLQPLLQTIFCTLNSMPLFWWSTWYKDYHSTWKHSVVSCSLFLKVYADWVEGSGLWHPPSFHAHSLLLHLWAN